MPRFHSSARPVATATTRRPNRAHDARAAARPAITARERPFIRSFACVASIAPKALRSRPIALRVRSARTKALARLLAAFRAGRARNAPPEALRRRSAPSGRTRQTAAARRAPIACLELIRTLPATRRASRARRVATASQSQPSPSFAPPAHTPTLPGSTQAISASRALLATTA